MDSHDICLGIDWVKILLQTSVDCEHCGRIADCIGGLLKSSPHLYYRDIYHSLVKLSNNGVEATDVKPVQVWFVCTVSLILVCYSLVVNTRKIVVGSGVTQEEPQMLLEEMDQIIKLIDSCKENGIRKLCENEEKLMQILDRRISKIHEIRMDIKESIKYEAARKYKVLLYPEIFAIVAGGVILYKTQSAAVLPVIYAANSFVWIYLMGENNLTNEQNQTLSKARMYAKEAEKEIRVVRSSIKTACVEAKITSSVTKG